MNTHQIFILQLHLKQRYKFREPNLEPFISHLSQWNFNFLSITIGTVSTETRVYMLIKNWFSFRRNRGNEFLLVINLYCTRSRSSMEALVISLTPILQQVECEPLNSTNKKNKLHKLIFFSFLFDNKKYNAWFNLKL